jgi:hypothetical protein
VGGRGDADDIGGELDAGAFAATDGYTNFSEFNSEREPDINTFSAPMRGRWCARV